jgi:hypothetical protein
MTVPAGVGPNVNNMPPPIEVESKKMEANNNAGNIDSE